MTTDIDRIDDSVLIEVGFDGTEFATVPMTPDAHYIRMRPGTNEVITLTLNEALIRTSLVTPEKAELGSLPDGLSSAGLEVLEDGTVIVVGADFSEGESHFFVLDE